MTLPEFNQLDNGTKRELLTQCCGATAWVDQMLAFTAVKSDEELMQLAEEIWWKCRKEDWLEAFQHHPKIGDLASLQRKYASTAAWASHEQSGVNLASNEILQKLAKGNDEYEKKFGFIFIVCATGKTAEQMLEFLTARLPNTPEIEIKIAAGEQNKITKLRMKKLFI